MPAAVRRAVGAAVPSPEYVAVIGLEVHAQLQRPRTKLFSRAPGASSRGSPNANVASFDAALPGALPRVNPEAVQQAVRTALALGSTVAPASRFERKHYHYCDLPAGYQITQQSAPLAVGGSLSLPDDTSLQRVRLTRIQLEQDSGKSTHHGDGRIDGGDGRIDGGVGDGMTLVDLNRAGVALVELVFEPDLRTPEQAGEALRTLQGLLRHIGVCDGNMENGSMRADLNISLAERPVMEGASVRHAAGARSEAKPFEETLENMKHWCRKRIADRASGGVVGRTGGAAWLLSGARVEVKNMNSIKFLVSAAQYEIERQVALLRAGQPVVQETRGYDPKTHSTYRLRSKEDVHDYRFFPDPDLPPVAISRGTVRRLEQTLPELPHAMRQRLMAAENGAGEVGVGKRSYGLSAYDAGVLIADPIAVLLFETVLKMDCQTPRPGLGGGVLDSKTVANFIINDFFAIAAERSIAIQEVPTTPWRILQLLRMVAEDVISSRTAKQVLSLMIDQALQAREQMKATGGVGDGEGGGKGGDGCTGTVMDLDGTGAFGPSPEEIVEANGWRQITSDAELAALTDAVVLSDEYSKDVEDWKQGGKRAGKVVKFLVGEAMKASRGRAAPRKLSRAVEESLERHTAATTPVQR